MTTNDERSPAVVRPRKSSSVCTGTPYGGGWSDPDRGQVLADRDPALVAAVPEVLRERPGVGGRLRWGDEVGEDHVGHAGTGGHGAELDGVRVVAEDRLEHRPGDHRRQGRRPARLVDEHVGPDRQLLDLGT